MRASASAPPAPAGLADAPSESAVPRDRWPVWIDVDLAAVAANVRALQAIARPRLGVTAVVKAQAYGLGAVAVARAALAAGARAVAVARVAEAAELRGAGISAPILLMGGWAPGETAEVVRLGLTPTLTDWGAAEQLAAAAGRAGRVLGVEVKVDTGITRYGAPPAEAMALVRGCARLASLRLDGFYTHFAAADDPDPFFAHQQLARYLAICRGLEAEGLRLGLRHAANSAGALRIPGAGLDTVRAGVALSGGYATGWVPRTGALRPAIAVKSRLVRLHSPAVGTSIGYGRTYKVYRPMRVGLVSCGYADGLPRACGNRGHVLVRGRRAPLVGTVSMDMTMVDVSHIPDAHVGDEVVLLGRQGDDEITLAQLAEFASTVPHELLVQLGGRTPRVYSGSGGDACASST